MTASGTQPRRGLLPRPIPRIWLVAGSGWLGRVLAISAQLLSVRMLTTLLGTDGYGVFAVLANMVGWFMLADFCIPLSLQNHISERRARNEPVEDITIVAIILLLVLALLTAVAVTLGGHFLSDRILSHFDFLPQAVGRASFLAVSLLTLGTALGSVVYKVWFSQHRGYLAHMVPAVATACGCLAVLAVTKWQPQPLLTWSIIAFYLPLALFPLLALVVLAGQILRRGGRPSLALFRPLVSRAAKFLVFSIFGPLVLQLDYIVLSQTVSTTDIVIYNVSTKYFSLVFFVYNALLMALWPVCSEALIHHRWDEVLKLVRRYIGFGAVITLLGAAAFLVLRDYVTAFLLPHDHIVIPMTVIALLAVYTLVRVWADSYGMVLQSMSDLGIFWKVVPVQAALCVPLEVLGAKYYGLPGLIAAISLCFLGTICWTLPRRCQQHAKAAAARMSENAEAEAVTPVSEPCAP